MLNVVSGAVALGLLWAIMTIGVYLTFRVLDIPDLSVEGSIVSGAAAAAVILVKGLSPLLAVSAAALAGAAGGCITAFFHNRLKIPALLSGILTMIALYSINIRIMNRAANIPLLRKTTIFSSLTEKGLDKNTAAIICGFVFVVIVIALIYWFLQTETGFAIRATGNNPHMARAQGVNIALSKSIALIISNALVGFSGGLIAQYQGFSDVMMGQGAIVIGLASLIIGEVLFSRRAGILATLIALTLGAVLYRIIIAFVIEAGMPATDLKLFTAITVAIALYLPKLKDDLGKRAKYRKGGKDLAENERHKQNL
jgi:putative ABC transport system permease protein